MFFIIFFFFKANNKKKLGSQEADHISQPARRGEKKKRKTN